MYMNYSAFSDILDEDRKNSTHPQLKHMEAFDEEDLEISMGSSLPTEFGMRPDLTPTGEEVHLQTFEKPQVEGSPSLPIRSENRNGTVEAPKPVPRREVIVDQKTSLIPKLVAVVKTTIISSIFLILIVCCLFIAIVELDVLREVRKIPEMVILRREYYEPIKRSVVRAISR